MDEYATFSRFLCLIISRKVKTQLKSKKKFCAVHGEDAVTDRMCQKWFVKFCAGDFSLDDASQSGGPVKVDSDQIKTCLLYTSDAADEPYNV